MYVGDDVLHLFDPVGGHVLDPENAAQHLVILVDVLEGGGIVAAIGEVHVYAVFVAELGIVVFVGEQGVPAHQEVAVQRNQLFLGDLAGFAEAGNGIRQRHELCLVAGAALRARCGKHARDPILQPQIQQDIEHLEAGTHDMLRRFFIGVLKGRSVQGTVGRHGDGIGVARTRCGGLCGCGGCRRGLSGRAGRGAARDDGQGEREHKQQCDQFFHGRLLLT